MATTTWTFGAEDSGFYVTVTFDGTNFKVSCIEGALDLNALWFSDGDGSGGEGGVTLPKNDRALSMDGTKVKWDAYAKLSSPGLKKGQTLDSKITYLTAGDTETYTLYDLNTGWITNWNDITLGLRATSVIGVLGTTSIKLFSTPSGPVRIFVLGESLTGVSGGAFVAGGDDFAFFDSNENGLLDADEISPTNAATFGVGGNVDLSGGAYEIEFIGTAGSPPIDLTGFGSDDSIIVNFSQDWVGAGLPTAKSQLAKLQRGSSSADVKGFRGYTFPSYSLRSSNPVTAGTSKRTQQFQINERNTTGVGRLTLLRVLMKRNVGSLTASFRNFTEFSDPQPKRPLIGGITKGKAVLATWTAGTSITGSQISVVWPNTYTAP